jgi:lipopolysaccharide export system permease protein
MFIIDRYLLKQFTQILVICFLSMSGLFIVIDAFEHLEAFSTQAGKEGNLLGIIARYYAYRNLEIFERTGGILAMLAAMFTVTWLGRHQEMTALLAGGISKVRILKPLLLAVIVVSLLGVLNRELMIPHVRDELMRDTKDLGGKALRDLEPRFDSRSNILLGGEKVVVDQRQIINPTFVLPGNLSRYGKQLVARIAYHQTATADHPAGFLLDGVISPLQIGTQHSLRLDLTSPNATKEEPQSPTGRGAKERGARSEERDSVSRTLRSGQEAASAAPSLDPAVSQVVIITPRDASWLKPDQLFVITAMPFNLLASGSQWRSYASTGELISQLGSPSTDLGADVRVTMHARLLQPLMDLTLVMLGLPLMFSRSNRNIFLSIGICIVAAIGFSAVAISCQSLGGLGLLSPAFAAWLPLMLFIPLATGMSGALRT